MVGPGHVDTVAYFQSISGAQFVCVGECTGA